MGAEIDKDLQKIFDQYDDEQAVIVVAELKNELTPDQIHELNNLGWMPRFNPLKRPIRYTANPARGIIGCMKIASAKRMIDLPYIVRLSGSIPPERFLVNG